ncbi:hypothetical protein TI39_contig47g00004 [Zymoseptoria brevis]|uniref:RBR-type E3 ubiquitin transferase n=1 Tax=Zymoseptoria brevis TaxID=1047168 RepID=A0A0F4GYK7_9PEZI|nr:hypothetical protein TI39_contig47g00004 [Zymoseptoria brevis]
MGSTPSCRACLSCWCQHLHSQLESLDHNKLSCLGCERILSTQEIMDIQARFKRKDRVEPKLQEKATMAFLRSQPDFVSCPSSACKDGASMADGHIFTCRTCRYRYCFDCNVPFHEDEGCQEFQDRIQEDERKTLEIAESLETVSKTTKACPECKTRIERSIGCDHMTCAGTNSAGSASRTRVSSIVLEMEITCTRKTANTGAHNARNARNSENKGSSIMIAATTINVH